MTRLAPRPAITKHEASNCGPRLRAAQHRLTPTRLRELPIRVERRGGVFGRAW